ncbi:MAG TPA: toll/interleukin-1 receptor domain-containing protein [Amycolatopsis sp.]|uniref:toll/interleukin-1 receptor domain-containing protein n=1 Tax=Amycolatopsis sp. TaxID=37632 RepID=UPI002B4A6B4B|nr:toll/interleukin-1 receptor domain-containing protein [Amycolatopsis sp.]HKS48328.1 toll/interleukin-1 receptor domain-containing protein [Amycolatopsis sp.]
MTVRQVINPGTLLWRVHPAGLGPAEFESGEARFSPHHEAALVEALVPDPKFTSTGRRVLPRELLEGKVASALRTRTELIVARLPFGADPAGADLEGVSGLAPSGGVGAVPLRNGGGVGAVPPRNGGGVGAVPPQNRVTPPIHGVSWPSERAMPHQMIVLFGHRCPPDALAPDRPIALDDEDGMRWLSGVLAPYRVELSGPAKPGPPLVFINYRTTGGTQEVYWLDDELRRRLGEHAVFRDHRSLRAGREFGPELLRNARGAKVMLAVIGERWDRTFDDRGRRLIDDSSDWVRREVAEALAHGVHVVPVLVGLRPKLDADALPEDIRKLAGLQVLHLRHRSTERDVASLVDQLFDEVPLLARAHAEYAAS